LEKWNEAVKTRGIYEARCRIWHAPSRAWRRCAARGAPLLAADGSVREWVGSCTDREDEERATEALRASEERKDAILMSALDAIITMDHEGRLLEFNPARNASSATHARRWWGFRWPMSLSPSG
jgi:PAS domain-containing protein